MSRLHVSPLPIYAVILLIAFSTTASAQGPDDQSSDPKVESKELRELLQVARDELRAAKLADEEVKLRLKIVESVATVKSYFPRAYRGRPETRNSEYWKLNDEGSYIPRGTPTEAISDLWKTTSGIRCRKLSTLVLLKGLIDVSDKEQLAELNTMLKGKVIPNDLDDDGIGTLFEKPEPKKGEIFEQEEFLPGDNVWFDNPYFDELSRKNQSKYRGQEGHHVFYIGGGKVMDMYSREAISIADFRKTFLTWGSVETVAEADDVTPKAKDFQVKYVRRVLLPTKR